MRAAPAPATALGRLQDPIVAIATAPGRGAVGIVRVSGRNLSPLIAAVCGRTLAPRQATLLPFLDAEGHAIDRGLALHFPAPHSYTGEEVLELQAHGGPVVLQLLLARCLQALPALRPADPGEFTLRAFLNDKLDLAQAEAVADLIDASTEAAARSAGRAIEGVFSQRVHALAQRIVTLRTLVEATLDFPEEEIDFLDRAGARAQLAAIRQALAELQQGARQGALLREGLRVVLAGQPNVGKSSLLNALAGAELAIVTPVPGTTRDKVSETIQIEGVPVHVTDTAGLRGADAAHDEVERIGIGRSWQAIGGADTVLFLHDLTRSGEPAYEAEERRIAAQLPADRRRCCTCTRRATCAPRCRPGWAPMPSRCPPAAAPGSTRCAPNCCSAPAGRPCPRACSSPAPATCRRFRAQVSTCTRRIGTARRAPRRWSCWPRSCGWRTRRWARSPASSRRTICWGRSSGASVSGSSGCRGPQNSSATRRHRERPARSSQVQQNMGTPRWTSPHWSRLCRP
jgi:tRNA modification GTPase